MDWTSIHDQFEINRKKIWLNNCGTVPAGNHAVKAVTDFIKGYAKQGTLNPSGNPNHVRAEIKTILSRLLNCHPDELGLIHHTAEGMNFISHGLPLSPGDEVILLENEYPSNVYPWRHLREKGVALSTTPMETTPEAFFESLQKRITQRTRVIAISAVHWCTGMPLPVHDVGRLCREREIYFVLDGAQGVGMRPIDVKRDCIDFMAFSAWKWLTGPIGLGGLYIARERLDSIKPIFVGTDSVVDDEAYLPYKDDLKPSVDRFTISTPNICDWVYFLASLRFLEDIGFEAVRERIFTLSRRLSDGLASLGYRVLTTDFPGHSTGIVVFEKDGISTEAIFERLKENGVVAAQRLDRVRLSPHVYLLPEQIDETLSVLEASSIND